ncbi:MAG: aldo/keto reductase [Rhodospirillaceae bacterium]|nr:aldo/keto reductase [Rhodospirillaceae bacterium]MQF86480.1 aldo/keto reductase [SAR202 cluster bacterium]|tara:strand:- start:1212 stop:2201 length:990 start_codon:yes stop_codon:yes gene_type:complete
MKFRKIGQTDLNASVIGAGGYPFGPPLLNEKQADSVIKKAYEMGINFFDTSDVYGQGYSEVFLGNATQGFRENIILSSKFNLRDLNGMSPRRRIFDRCEDALFKLKTDYLDLFQVHFSTPEIPHAELLGPLNDLVTEGKVRYLGNCNTYSWRWLEELQCSHINDYAEFESTQNHYSLLYRYPELELIPFCKEHGKSLLAYFPLGGGWLTGIYRPGKSYPLGSRASKVPTGIVTRMRSERVDRLVPILERFAAERGHTLSELALSWVLSHNEIAVALTGFDRPEHVELNLKSIEWTLSEDEINELDRLTSWWDGDNAIIDSSDPTPRLKG